ncbi:MAG: type II toxin-antitoxin system prevent-host-death family antitoxin [Amaricoccus sp.]
MKQFNIHEAKTHFSKLVAAVEAGERVVICRDGKPIAEVVPSQPATPFPFGAWRDLLPDAGNLAHLAEPTDEETLKEMGL